MSGCIQEKLISSKFPIMPPDNQSSKVEEASHNQRPAKWHTRSEGLCFKEHYAERGVCGGGCIQGRFKRLGQRWQRRRQWRRQCPRWGKNVDNNIGEGPQLSWWQLGSDHILLDTKLIGVQRFQQGLQRRASYCVQQGGESTRAIRDSSSARVTSHLHSCRTGCWWSSATKSSPQTTGGTFRLIVDTAETNRVEETTAPMSPLGNCRGGPT